MVNTERRSPWGGGKTFAQALDEYKAFVIEEAIQAGELPVDTDTIRKAKEYDALVASGVLAALGINP